jgi:hypothetical protein
MGPVDVNEAVVKETFLAWFAESGDLALEVYKPHSGCGGDFYILSSYSQFQDLIAKARPGSIIFTIKERQFPVRGLVDDDFIAEALRRVADDQVFEIIEPCEYPNMINFLGDGGRGHVELKTELEKLRGAMVWLGGELRMPGGNYWAENIAPDEMVAIKPESVSEGTAA